MPKTPWTGYGRFCPLARALDVVGDRWTLVIIQELLKRPSRYGELVRRLPGIGTTVLAERLRKLEAAGVVERRPGAVGDGVVYAATERGLALGDTLESLRRWGVTFLTDPTADGADGANGQAFDLRYVDGSPTALRFADGHLQQIPREPDDPELVVATTSSFMARWAAGELTWDDGVATGAVTLTGPADAWPRWLAATGYLLRYEPEPADA